MFKTARLAGLVFVAILVALSLPQLTDHVMAWGKDGHYFVNESAARHIPDSMPKWMRENRDGLIYYGYEPDRWKNSNSEAALKYAQEPDHFIDLEDLPADFGELPRDRVLYQRKLYEKYAAAIASGMDKKKAEKLLPDKIGYNPYAAIEVYQRLRVAFREYRHAKAEKRETKYIERDAAFYAGWLGHYVGDGANPLHATIHYNGWAGENPNGYSTSKDLHWDFESRNVTENVKVAEVTALVKEPTQLKDVWKDYNAYLRESQGRVEELYKLEKAGAFKPGAATEDGKKFTREMVARGGQMLLNMWYTAWMESATDPVDPYADPKPKAPAPTQPAAPEKK